jgi:carbonic anhydrase
MLFWSTRPIDRLIEGYREFHRTTFARRRRQYERLAERGQKPKILIISCSDSRVSPSVVFNTPPGAIFVARNIANIVPPHNPDGGTRSIGAAVEYAVKVLNVTDIVVKGHARCGGVHALIENGNGLPENDYLKPWVEVAAPARKLLPPNFDELGEAEKRRVSERHSKQHHEPVGVSLGSRAHGKRAVENSRHAFRFRGWALDAARSRKRRVGRREIGRS